MKIKIKKNFIFTSLFLLFCALILLLAVKGLAGNPSVEQINSTQWKEDGPFELSPERGRFAVIYSLAEDGSTNFSLPLAQFTTPDLGYINGSYVSLFNPGVPFLAAAGYLIGKIFGFAQVGSFLVIAVFALLNATLIFVIARKVGAHQLAGYVAALVFLFGTPAFAYGTTLYQHHVSVLLILLSVFLLLRYNSAWSVALVWFISATAVVVDSPNLLLMLPIGLAALGKFLKIEKNAKRFQINFSLLGVLTIAAAIPVLAFFLWYNQVSYGSPLQLPSTVARVLSFSSGSGNSQASEVNSLVPEVEQESEEETVVGFFESRNLMNGFYIHTLSPDRGVLVYAPIVLFGILGIILLFKRNSYLAKILVSIAGLNLLIYSLWGDPYGGWSFGSRYMIPTYAILSIGVAKMLTRWKNNTIILGLFLAVMTYSVWVNSLGAITSNANPPKIEVLGLEEVTGIEQKYTFERNYDLIRNNNSKSFVFQSYAQGKISAELYHLIITGAILATASVMLVHIGSNKKDIANEKLR